MSDFAAFHPAIPQFRCRSGLRATLTAVAERLVVSPIDSPVLDAIAVQAPPRPCRTRMRARWQTVTTADGTVRLEASWHRDH